MARFVGYSDVFPQREMWEQIAKETNGEFHIKLTYDNALESHNIDIPYKKWKIKISASDTHPMKFHMQFTAHQEFVLTISWEDFIEKIRKKLGGQDVEIGSKEFDHHYLIKSNKPHLVKELITSDIQKCYLKYNVYSLAIQFDSGKNNLELISVIQRIPGKKEMVMELINAFKLLTDNLERARIIR